MVNLHRQHSPKPRGGGGSGVGFGASVLNSTAGAAAAGGGSAWRGLSGVRQEGTGEIVEGPEIRRHEVFILDMCVRMYVHVCVR